ncbi:PP2C family protein-serine/threonine phosphatase [Deinococcota bacterium DY0809b]
MSGPSEAPAVEASALTHPGRKRTTNQDAVGQKLTDRGGVFVVADGMGGHRTGELASKLAVKNILEVTEEDTPSPTLLLEAFEEANDAIYMAGQRPESRGMGTTATALALDLPYALIAHVGDSRAYLLRDGVLTQLTQDHSWVAERLRQGLLTPTEARNHRWRNVITNALGSFPEARVDLIGLKVQAGDRFLICSDGLSGVLEDAVLQEVLESMPPDAAAERLVKLANEWGGPDNISVVTVSVNRIPEDRAPPPWALPLEGGEPVVLAMGQEDESVHTQVIEPGRPRSFWHRWRDLIFLIVYVALLLFVLLFNNR